MSTQPADRQPSPDETRPDPMADLEQAQELLCDTSHLRGGTELAALKARARQWGAAEAFEALREVATAIAGNLDLASLIDQILDVAIQFAGAERGILFLGKAGSPDLAPMRARRFTGEQIVELERISTTLLRQGLLGQTIETPDARADGRFVEAQSVQIKQIRAVLCLPMRVRAQIIGLLYVDAPEAGEPFPPHVLGLLTALAGLAAVALENARLHGDALEENARLRRQLPSRDAFGRLVTADPTMQATLRQARLAAEVDCSVMLFGRSGTGKELLARALHDAGPRATHPFVPVNCAAIPDSLLEASFFGYLRGAFTGATRDTAGFFQQADHGTLFLDEIAELDPNLQAKLLRVVDDGTFRPLGGQEDLKADVRLIVATNKDILAEVQAGRFREDLYFRVSTIELTLPTLAERAGDIPILLEHFIQKHGLTLTPPRRLELTPEAIAYLQQLPWVGNVRELENFVFRSLVLGDTPRIDHTQAEKLVNVPIVKPDAAAAHRNRGGGGMPPPGHLPEPAPSINPSQRGPSPRAITEALRETGGNISAAGRMLGIDRNALRRRMKKYGIEHRRK